MKSNNKFADRVSKKDIENFYNVMNGKKTILTKKEQEEFEASYFAMCLLIPKETFLNVVNCFGGLETVKNNPTIKAGLARLFFVEEKLINIRINDLIEQQKDKNNCKVLKNNISKQQN